MTRDEALRDLATTKKLLEADETKLKRLTCLKDLAMKKFEERRRKTLAALEVKKKTTLEKLEAKKAAELQKTLEDSAVLAGRIDLMKQRVMEMAREIITPTTKESSLGLVEILKS